MKRLLMSLLVLLPMLAAAQVHFGYLSYNSVLKQMPEYQEAQKNLTELKTKYDQEAKRGEEEFQRKFSEFLQGQKDFPQNILVKRQTELQDLMDKAVSFREECQKLLSEAEQQMMDNMSKKLDSAINEVGMTSGLFVILNTDDHACPFLNPALGEDVTTRVLTVLGIVTPPAADTGAEAQPAADTATPANE